MKVLVVAETKDGALRKTSLELLAQAQKLGASDITALLIGKGVSGLSEKLAHHGASKVLVAENDALEHYNTEAYTQVVQQAVESIQANLVLFAASANGKDLAPRLSARLDAGLVSDALELSHDGSKFVAKRPIFAGKTIATVSGSIIPQNTVAFPVTTAKYFRTVYKTQ